MSSEDRSAADLAAALLALARPRQFGPCWCETAAGLFCVGQPQCRQAESAIERHNRTQTPKE